MKTTAHTTVTTVPARLGPKRKTDVDLKLAVACTLNPPGHEWDQLELAEYLGVHHSWVQQVEAAALKKLRLRVPKMAAILDEQGLTYNQCRPRLQKAA